MIPNLLAILVFVFIILLIFFITMTIIFQMITLWDSYWDSHD